MADKKKSYNPISGYWLVIVPTVVGGVTYYAYNTSGYVSNRVRYMVDPVVQPLIKLVGDFFPY